MLEIALENILLFDMFYFLGVAKSFKELRELMENRCEVKGDALRIEIAVYMEEEGQTSDGCPLAKYIIRRYVSIFAR